MCKTCLIVVLFCAFIFTGCQSAQSPVKTFGQDVKFMQKHTDVISLSDRTGKAMAAIVPAYQGRVMTSTADGPEGPSFGWLNYQAIASGKIQPHINVYGGEERFWLGPEGSQFSIFFKKDAPFDLEHWQTPAVIDTEPFDVVSSSQTEVKFTKRAKLINKSGAEFELRIDRKIRLLNRNQTSKVLGVRIPQTLKMVSFETDNSITNTGQQAWAKETGLLSIWLLGMLKHSPQTTVVIPFRAGPQEQLGPTVNDTYFGKVPADRLVVRDNVLFFKADGQYRSKIGIPPQRAMPVCGSYDASTGVLTLVHYNKPEGITDYVNSMWEDTKKPYSGDVVNAYNDGPPGPGKKPLGPFYELETSSPAALLNPGQAISHTQQTIHLQGPTEELDRIAKATLGVSIAQITSALPK